MKIASLSLLLLLLLAHPALAQSIEIEEPGWYFLLEIIGSFISVLALVGLLRISKIMGGAIGSLLKSISFGMAFITAALLLRSFFELTESESFMSDLSFEIALYSGLLIIFVSVEIAIRRLKKIKSSS